MIENLDRKQLKIVLKLSLRIQPWNRYHNVYRENVAVKLNSLLAYGLLDKKLISGRESSVVHEYFVEGWNYRDIAIQHAISINTVKVTLNNILDKVIDNCPISLIASIVPKHFKWVEDGCPKCQGDIYWDEEGAHGDRGEYCCINCGYRLDSDMLPVFAIGSTSCVKVS